MSLFYKTLYKVALPMKRWLIPLIPQSARKRMKRAVIMKAYAKELAVSQEKTTIKDSVTGINLIGYVRAEMGIGESCRIAAKCLNTTDIPFGMLNFEGTNTSRMSDLTWQHKETEKPSYNVNILHVNAEQVMEVFTYYGQDLFRDRYNIGYWHWELPDFPDDWLDGFRFLDEVWVPSRFVAESVAMKSPVPVVTIPHGIEVTIDQPHNREYFGIPQNAFLFLTMFDMNSFQARKNPMASIEAFKLAFEPKDQSVGLIVKVNNADSNKEDWKSLLRLTEGYANIYLLRETFSRNDTNALLQCADAFISLHRSEGFGLGLAEAMYLGKPAIGTNWSANTDFMNNQNSCLVNYELVQVGKDYGPYQAYQTWANPDVEHARQFMRKLVTDSSYYNEVAISGQQTIRGNYSPSAIGEMIEKRLKYIQKHFGGITHDN